MRCVCVLLGCVLVISGVAGCDAAGMTALHAANAVAQLGGYELHRDVSYGPNSRHELDIYVPADASGPRPVVIFFHGGDWSEQYPAKDMHRFVGEALTSRGLVAVLVNYRRYPSVRFPAFVRDGARAVAWAREHVGEYGGDPDGLFLMGHSAGAHIASMLTVNERYLREAEAEPRWIAGLIGLAGPYSFLPMPDEPLLKDLFGPPSRYPLSQPVNYVDADEPPMLLLSGGKDRRVPPQVMRRMVRAVRGKGGRVTAKTYDHLDHIMLLGSLATPVRWYESVADDVAEWVRGRWAERRRIGGDRIVTGRRETGGLRGPVAGNRENSEMEAASWYDRSSLPQPTTTP